MEKVEVKIPVRGKESLHLNFKLILQYNEAVPAVFSIIIIVYTY